MTIKTPVYSEDYLIEIADNRYVVEAGEYRIHWDDAAITKDVQALRSVKDRMRGVIDALKDVDLELGRELSSLWQDFLDRDMYDIVHDLEQAGLTI